jgi:hypothetical protein
MDIGFSALGAYLNAFTFGMGSQATAVLGEWTKRQAGLRKYSHYEDMDKLSPEQLGAVIASMASSQSQGGGQGGAPATGQMAEIINGIGYALEKLKTAAMIGGAAIIGGALMGMLPALGALLGGGAAFAGAAGMVEAGGFALAVGGPLAIGVTVAAGLYKLFSGMFGGSGHDGSGDSGGMQYASDDDVMMPTGDGAGGAGVGTGTLGTTGGIDWGAAWQRIADLLKSGYNWAQTSGAKTPEGYVPGNNPGIPYGGNYDHGGLLKKGPYIPGGAGDFLKWQVQADANQAPYNPLAPPSAGWEYKGSRTAKFEPKGFLASIWDTLLDALSYIPKLLGNLLGFYGDTSRLGEGAAVLRDQAQLQAHAKIDALFADAKDSGRTDELEEFLYKITGQADLTDDVITLEIVQPDGSVMGRGNVFPRMTKEAFTRLGQYSTKQLGEMWAEFSGQSPGDVVNTVAKRIVENMELQRAALQLAVGNSGSLYTRVHLYHNPITRWR